ncbi:MAG: hypothetical protein ABIJ27_06635 [Candidatus Omnitrophota bacterium]
MRTKNRTLGKSISLIGMPGAGKSAAGKELATAHTPGKIKTGR